MCEPPTASYSDFTPEVTTTCCQLSESSRIKASISSGEVPAPLSPLRGELVLHSGRLARFLQRGREPRRDWRGQATRRDGAVPILRQQLGKAKLAGGRHVRQCRAALPRGERQGGHRPGLDVRQQRRQVGKEQLDLPRD